MNKPFLSDLSNAIKNNDKVSTQPFFGVVKEKVLDADNKVIAYRVSLGGNEDVVEARKFAGANVGDVVLLTPLNNGSLVVTGTRDGDTDAKEAIDVADGVAQDLATNYSTTEEMNNAIDDAIGRIVPESAYEILEYAKSSSSTTAPTSGWSKNVPSLDTTNKYLWTRRVRVENGTETVVSGSTVVSTTMSGTFTFLNSAVNSGGTTITGSAIYGGTITLGGSNNVNGQLTVKNASGSVTTQLNRNGLYSISGTIGGWNIGSSELYYGCTSLTSTTQGTYIGAGSSGGIRNVGSGSFPPTATLQSGDLTFTQGSSYKCLYNYKGFSLTAGVNLYMRFTYDSGIYWGGTNSFMLDNDGIYSDGYVQAWDYLCGYRCYTGTSSSAANGRIATSESTGLGLGTILRSTASSRRYKHDIKDIEGGILDPERLYSLPVRQYKYNDNYLNASDSRFNRNVAGFIAEEIDEVYPIACEYNDDGMPEDWNGRILLPPMLRLIQKQHTDIELLKERIRRLEA